MPRRYGQSCPVALSLDLLGDRWTLLIVRDLLRGRGRFQELGESLPGIAPNILSDRLKLLEEHGVVTRRFYSDHPPRAEYVLTDKGRELGVVIGALASWGAPRRLALDARAHRPRPPGRAGLSLPGLRRAAEPRGHRAAAGRLGCRAGRTAARRRRLSRRRATPPA